MPIYIIALTKWDLVPIAQNPEKYMSISAYIRLDSDDSKSRFKVKFIDSLQLMNSSLATLADNFCKGGKYDLMKHTMAMRNQFPNISEAELAAKGIFPSSYVDSWAKLAEEELPPINDFFDELEGRLVTTEVDYARAQRMYERFGLSTALLGNGLSHPGRCF